MRWKPKQTWVVYASMVEGHFDPAGRRDQELVDALLEAGVPDAQMFFLPDQEATAANILEAISSVGEQAEEEDALLFIFSGHGALQATDDGWTNRYVVEGKQHLTSQEVGALVFVNDANSQANSKGATGVVEETFNGLHLVRFDDRDEDDLAKLYDWVSYKRLTLQ